MEDQQREDLISAEFERFDRLIAPLYAEIDARIARDLPEEFDETGKLIGEAVSLLRQHSERCNSLCRRGSPVKMTDETKIEVWEGHYLDFTKPFPNPPPSGCEHIQDLYDYVACLGPERHARMFRTCFLKECWCRAQGSPFEPEAMAWVLEKFPELADAKRAAEASFLEKQKTGTIDKKKWTVI